MSVLALFDSDEREHASSPGMRREDVGDVVRHVDLVSRSGTVIYSRLGETSDVAGVIEAQRQYFGELGQDFEWKVYAHDWPADLTDRLAAQGFEIEEREAVMVLALDKAPATVFEVRHDIRRVTSATDLQTVRALKERVHGGDGSELAARLAWELEQAPNYLSIYVACMEDEVVACAWARFPERSAFASLWGGSTLPEQRGLGLYSSLVAARLREARQRGSRYVTVDAGPMSQPILERRSFHVLTYATACTYSAAGA